MTNSNKEPRLTKVFGIECDLPFKAGATAGIDASIDGPVLYGGWTREEVVAMLIADRTTEARMEQIMQDFLSLNVLDLTDFYEDDLIRWREEQMDNLKGG